MSHGALASKTSTPSSRVAGGATRVAADSQPVAQRHAKPYSAVAPSSGSRLSTPGRSTSSTVRSTERTARLSSRTRSASTSSKRANALRRRDGVAGPAPRWRARATAEEMLWVSSKAERSASISFRSNCRWPPAVRRGSGEPKRRSHERRVLGLTPSMAAAALVRIAPMRDVSSVGEVCATLARDAAAWALRCRRRRAPRGADATGCEAALGPAVGEDDERGARRAAGGDARPEADAVLLGRTQDDMVRLAGPAGRVDDQVDQRLRPADLDVGRHEQVADVRVDDLGLGRHEQRLGQAAHGADGELAVDQQERVLGTRRSVGRRGDEQSEPAARADARSRLDVGRLRLAAAVPTELDVGTGAVSVAWKGDETGAFDHEAFT